MIIYAGGCLMFNTILEMWYFVEITEVCSHFLRRTGVHIFA